MTQVIAKEFVRMTHFFHGVWDSGLARRSGEEGEEKLPGTSGGINGKGTPKLFYSIDRRE